MINKIKQLKCLSMVVVSAISLAACSNDEPGNSQDAGGETKYLSVQIVPTSTEGSRSTASFENGKGKENEVKKVRFYFFTEGGDAVNVKSGKNDNYYDWTNPTPGAVDGIPNQNVDMAMNAVIVVDAKKGDLLPAMVFAVINPDEAVLGTSSYNLTDLRNLYSDYAARATTGSFVMANSVYANGAEVVKATKLLITDFKTTEADATASPVKIYVERNVAKARASFNPNLSFTNGLLQAKDKDENPITVFGKDGNPVNVFVKINGWNITTTMPAANLSKHIDLTWNNNVLGSNVEWNAPTLFRSYWASQNAIGGNKHVNISWNAAKSKNFGTDDVVYINENAERKGDSGLAPTRIIVGATLCDDKGNPLTVCDYAGLKFVDNANLESLKNMVLTYLNNNDVTYYKKTTEAGATKYTKITPADITFKQNTAASSEKYTVFAILTEDAGKCEWYSAKSEEDDIVNPDPETMTPVPTADLNTRLKDQKTAMVYTDGATYYFAPIKHYEKDGVVRNHIYNIIVDNFYGLGTPVYDPGEIIDPEKPKSDDAYLAAQIYILSWRLMTNNVTFD